MYYVTRIETKMELRTYSVAHGPYKTMGVCFMVNIIE